MLQTDVQVSNSKEADNYEQDLSKMKQALASLDSMAVGSLVKFSQVNLVLAIRNCPLREKVFFASSEELFGGSIFQKIAHLPSPLFSFLDKLLLDPNEEEPCPKSMKANNLLVKCKKHNYFYTDVFGRNSIDEAISHHRIECLERLVQLLLRAETCSPSASLDVSKAAFAMMEHRRDISLLLNSRVLFP